MRFTYTPRLGVARGEVAKLIGAETDECVLVPNATSGVNIVLRNLLWEPCDTIVYSSWCYLAYVFTRK